MFIRGPFDHNWALVAPCLDGTERRPLSSWQITLLSSVYPIWRWHLSSKLIMLVYMLYNIFDSFKKMESHNRLRCRKFLVTVFLDTVLQNRTGGALRKISGPRRDVLTGEWWRVHKEQLYGLYSSPNIIRLMKPKRMRPTGHAKLTVERWGVYRVFLGKPEGKETTWKTQA